MFTLRTLTRTIAVLIYWIVFVVLIAFLPIAVNYFGLFQSFLLGLYRDLTALDLFWVAVAGGIAMWSLMITQALIIDGVEARYLLFTDAAANRELKAFGQQPLQGQVLIFRRVETLLNFPVTWWQILFYFALVAPSLGILIYYSAASLLMALLAAAAGILVAFVLMFVFTLPAFAAGATTLEVSKLIALLCKIVPGLEGSWQRWCERRLLLWLRRLVSYPVRWLRLHYVLETVAANGPKPLLVSSHFLALVTILVLSAWYFVIRWLVRPPSWLEFPAVVHLLILITLMIWLVQCLEFHLSRARIPTYLFLIVLVVGAQWVRDSDYLFDVVVLKQPLAARLTPVDVASTAKDNLVVVTSTGGGILAAGWTTQALEKLITARPALAQEIRLISAASGGSVGTAFYINELLHQQGCEPTPDLLHHIHAKSVLSSLSAAAYGFSFTDFWTILAGGPIFAKTDRGKLLDERWRLNADGTAAGEQPRLSDFQEKIRSGCIPAPIFNTTVMENGRRVMITPMDFSTIGGKRAGTLSEYLFYHDRGDQFNYTDTLDVGLWTAARLSATFPYISPATRADLSQTQLKDNAANFLRHHFIDGGYHDNYGVASAIDWLDAVFDERATADPQVSFKRVLIIQLRVSPTGNSRYAPSASGYSAAFLGPLIGLVQIRNGAAYARNEAELERFIKAWRGRFGMKVAIDTVILEPTFDADLPLSWHLTKGQIASLRAVSWHGNLDRCVTEIDHFLSEPSVPISSLCREASYR